jgi:DNA-binding HxlR family transcriptional regulator
MQRTPLGEMACSLARTLDVAGEWWTPLIVRDVWIGRTRFDEIQHNLGLSRKVLAGRLDTLVREGILERRPYRERPLRHEYVLTEKGNDLMGALLALLAWGDRWTADDAGPPMHLRHKRCGELIAPNVSCSSCGEPLRGDEVRLEPGPGARTGRGTRRLERLPAHYREDWSALRK